MKFRARGFEWEMGLRTLVMGVINITPDSFSDGGECLKPDRALDRALDFKREGADIVDLGAESSRPGAHRLSTEEELGRLMPVLTLVHEAMDLPISVDTTKSLVAAEALREGASIVNDVSGLREDARLAEVVADYGAGLVIMHRRGDAQTMQQLASYGDVVSEVFQELKESIDIALKAGISYDQIVVDPGIGFAKTTDQNLCLIKKLDVLAQLDRPILVGTSRKSFIGEILGRPARERVFGTAATVGWCVARGVHMVRVHDVREMSDVIRVTEAIMKAL